MRALTSLNVCVFCGAAQGYSPAAIKACAKLGELIADRGHQLIYGAGGVGLMGELAASAARHKGRIVGVIPRFLRQRERTDLLPPQDLVLTDDLFERKRLMLDCADCYIALPGGYGTLDEIMEVISMAALGLHRKPIVLINVDAVWDPFLSLVNHLLREGFIRLGNGNIFQVAATPGEAIEIVETRSTQALRGRDYQEVSYGYGEGYRQSV